MEDLQEICYAPKTAVINKELKRPHVDIATIQETQLTAGGSLIEKNYTFFWQGKSHELGSMV